MLVIKASYLWHCRMFNNIPGWCKVALRFLAVPSQSWKWKMSPDFAKCKIPPVETSCYCYFVQSLSHVQLFGILWTVTCQAPLSFTVSQSLLKFKSIESVMLSNHLILCRLLLLLPSIFLAQDTLSLLPGVMAILSLACESLAISFPSPFKSLSHLANIYCAY